MEMKEQWVCKVGLQPFSLVHAAAPLWTPRRRNLVELLHCRHVMEVRIRSSSSLYLLLGNSRWTQRNNQALLCPVDPLLVSVCVRIKGQSLLLSGVLVNAPGWGCGSEMSRAGFKSLGDDHWMCGETYLWCGSLPCSAMFLCVHCIQAQLKNTLQRVLCVSPVVIFISCKANRWRACFKRRSRIF